MYWVLSDQPQFLSNNLEAYNLFLESYNLDNLLSHIQCGDKSVYVCNGQLTNYPSLEVTNDNNSHDNDHNKQEAKDPNYSVVWDSKIVCFRMHMRSRCYGNRFCEGTIHTMSTIGSETIATDFLIKLQFIVIQVQLSLSEGPNLKCCKQYQYICYKLLFF